MPSTSNKKVVGILALQGCVDPHIEHFSALGFETLKIKKPKELALVAGLILPGGESTTMLKLIDAFGFREALNEASKRIPFWGICAGSILMAKKVHSPTQESFGWLDIEIERNAYGSQLDSFEYEIQGEKIAFIRAPKILSVGANVQIIEQIEGSPVFVKLGQHIATTFHPELSTQRPSFVHRAFAELL